MKIFSPWTPEEVELLNQRQWKMYLHPYTCGNCGETLKATITGWRCPNIKCDYRQNWAHKDDVEGRNL